MVRPERNEFRGAFGRIAELEFVEQNLIAIAGRGPVVRFEGGVFGVS